VLLHDVASAALVLKTATIDEKSAPDVVVAEEAKALLAEEAGDYMTAAIHWDLFSRADANPAVAAHNPSDICLAAPAYERTGQPMKADAALAAVGSLTFVDCDRFRGDVLDLRGDWAGAQAAYAQAVKLAPSIPSGYYSWGLALAKHGDLDGALAKLRQASEKGPHWADPLKAMGDVFARRQQWAEARARYDDALKYAPQWAALRQARDPVARHCLRLRTRPHRHWPWATSRARAPRRCVAGAQCPSRSAKKAPPSACRHGRVVRTGTPAALRAPALAAFRCTAGLMPGPASGASPGDHPGVPRSHRRRRAS
jgi:tetratricopeptide (TPR) repeat protein